MQLTLANGEALNAATDASGYYEFNGLPAGAYQVQVMSTTSPTSGSTVRPFTLADGQQVTDIDFGFSPSAVQGVQLEAEGEGLESLALTGANSSLRLVGFALCLLGLGILLAPRRKVVPKHRRR